MNGKLIIEGEDGYEIEITNKDIKVLKRLMVQIESEICRTHCMSPNIREVQQKDVRLKTLYKLLNR